MLTLSERGLVVMDKSIKLEKQDYNKWCPNLGGNYIY
jgi:hypothetical protein